MRRLILALVLLAAVSSAARAQDDAQQSICLMIESAARANNLPVEFFARVIWRESRFDPDAVGPRTRGGRHAQGIAQFMPGTAAERNLLDPFDPVQALPKAAEFLADLRGQFGNLGLAAAAYNAGPARVRGWRDNGGTMPGETRRYVEAVTGKSIEEWANANDGAAPTAPADCNAMMAMLTRTPNAFVAALAQRVSLGAAKVWGVQLAAGFSRDRALATYARTLKRFETMLDGKDPALIGAMLRSRGTRTFYQVRIGTDSRGEADKLCAQLRGAGGACLVLRNGRVRLLLDFRNNRDSAHLGGFDANSMDALFVMTSATWIMCELIRVYGGYTMDHAQKIVDTLSVKEYPVVMEREGELFITRHDLKAKEEVLVLLTKNSSATGELLQEKSGDSNKSRFQRNLREMVSDKFIGRAASGEYFIMPRGQALVTKKSLLTYRP